MLSILTAHTLSWVHLHPEHVAVIAAVAVLVFLARRAWRTGR